MSTPILVAMSGGVDSSVAAALLLQQGYDVCGVTMKLWGGESDTGCCSVSDVDDARRVAQQLGIEHHVFNFGDDFERHVVSPYVADHAAGRTPNPCVECNRYLKFDKLLRRARVLGFELVATGHHARIVDRGDGGHRVARGADRAKDQSYVVAVLGQQQLVRVRFPLGDRTKDEVRALALTLGLRTATKPDSQEVCFITSSGGRAEFLGRRTPLHRALVVDGTGAALGSVDAVELVTVGQRRGLGLPGGTGAARFAVTVDVPGRRVVVGGAREFLASQIRLRHLTWADGVHPGRRTVLVQCSAHGGPRPGVLAGDTLTWDEPQRRVAPGQLVVFYEGDEVLGSGVADDR